MSRRWTGTAILVGLMLAACGAAPVQPSPSPAGPPAVTAAPSAPESSARPTAAPPLPSPSPSKRSSPSPRLLPVPPKPAGVRFESASEGTCPEDPRELCSIDEQVVTVSWERPRTKGVQIRVYGVTECFGTDAGGQVIDGACLREHTVLPASVRVLLAKVPASRGRVTIRMVPSAAGIADTRRDVTVYSLVLAAYNAEGGHSIFAIAATGEYCVAADLDCTDD